MVITWPDAVNAVVELGAVALNVMSIRRLWKDQQIKGVTPLTFFYWLALSGWSVVLYSTQPTLPLSYAVSFLVFGSLAVYVGLFVWISWRNH